MAVTYFDPSQANELAKFQGTFAGIQAGNASVCGTAMAPTSIYNQAGYYALQDTNTGYVSLQKLADDSLYTRQWYDQGTGTIFDFSNGGTGITSVNQTSGSSTTGSNGTTGSTSGTTSNSSASSSSSSTTSSNGLIQYPWGPGYIAVPPTGTTTTNQNGSNQVVDEDGNQIMLTAKDLQELVDAGVYENLEEALNETLGQGYGVEDSEQAKLGIYSQDDEAKIQLMMDKYGYTREEAINELGNKVEPKDDKNELQAKIDNLKNSGFTHKEAIDYMKALGYDIPAELEAEPAEYSDEDEAKISALMNSTGCSREDAIKALGCQPKQPEKLGLIRSIGKGIGDFFSGIGKGISNAWHSFVDWIW